MEALEYKDLVYPELLYGKVCRWLDQDIEENVRLALLANDLNATLWEYQDQQDAAIARIREIVGEGRGKPSKNIREMIAINKFIDSLSGTIDAIRQAFRERESTPRNEGKLGTL